MNENKPKDASEDITEAELQAIQDQVDQEIAKNGLPTAAQILREIDALDQSQSS
jgi:hypothetical protein